MDTHIPVILEKGKRVGEFVKPECF